MDKEVLYLPLTNSYPNALHSIPAPNVIFSGISDGKNVEDDMGQRQLKSEEVIQNYNNNFFEGSKVIENNFQTSTESSISYNLSYSDLEAVTVQSSGEVAASEMGNQELENTPQKPSASEPDQIDPDKYLKNDSETLNKLLTIQSFTRTHNISR